MFLLLEADVISFLCLVIPMCMRHLMYCLFTMKQEILLGLVCGRDLEPPAL